MGAVGIGGVNKVYSQLNRSLEDPNRLRAVLGWTPDASAGEAHRPESHAIDREIFESQAAGGTGGSVDRLCGGHDSNSREGFRDFQQWWRTTLASCRFLDS